MNNDETNWSAIIIIGLIIWGGVSLFSNDDEPEPKSVSGYGTTNIYNTTNDYNNYDDEPENPYDDGTGHSAGYEWAEENDVSSCDGNSDSFIEGCQEYVDQRDEYDDNEEDEY